MDMDLFLKGACLLGPGAGGKCGDFVSRSIRLLKTNKAVGLDKISARLVKDLVDVITPSLTNLQIIVNLIKYFKRSFCTSYAQYLY